ncbi:MULTISPECIES: hypothetical protein [Streptomyces]|uniref:Secreted protein n=1 Tax=Streptomyces lasiicapitis TaxID=1923961 RepID=A0ABQ2M349_9ACTN|nr:MULTISPECIES: hypothetical protein [Streptomyces]QIB48081.1 hypothetical protein G3H79_38460 [Streptomyces aureoverticillatus]GGO46291.1 hypothetical protein GCM10012286_36860 [Streptomyces lasiicapitis]
MKLIPMRRAATLVPAGVATFFAASILVAPAAHADAAKGCAGGYAKYTSKGDFLYVKDRKADGRTVFINLTGPGGFAMYEVLRGAGKSFTWDLDRPEGKTNKIVISLVKGKSTDDDSNWKHCATFKFRT